MKLGRINIDGKIVLAPLAGYTDSPFRRIARRHGAALVFTELISSEGIVRNHEKTLNFLKFHEEERPIGIQIFGNDPAVMVEAARKVEEYKPDVIDINMGCCARKVCNSGNGSALLNDVAKTGQIAAGIVKTVKTPVSAKIRIGWDFESLNYREIVGILKNSGVSHITVHGRTRSQNYTGQADWNIIKELAEFSGVDIIGNGDIETHSEACSLLHSTKCAAVMIGRKAVGNPWIFSGTNPGIKKIIETVKEHYCLMLDFYGDYGLILMRKHFVKYIHGFKNASNFRNLLIRTTDHKDILAILESLENSNLITS